MINFIIHYWFLILLAVLLLAGCGYIRFALGNRFAAPVAALGAALIVFLAGRKTERDNYQKRAQDIEEKREKAYEKIDNRNTSASDTADRLRDGSF